MLEEGVRSLWQRLKTVHTLLHRWRRCKSLRKDDNAWLHVVYAMFEAAKIGDLADMLDIDDVCCMK